MRVDSMPLAALAEVRSGGGAPQESGAFTASGHPFVRAGSLSKLLAGASEDSLEHLAPEAASEHGLRLFPSGTVLFAKSGMSATKGYVYGLRRPAYVVNHLAALIPRQAADSAFVVRLLEQFSPVGLVKDPAYPSIRLGDIEDMKVVAPPNPADRQRIAEVLDRAEALRAKRRAALAQLDTLTQSIFLDMFGDPRIAGSTGTAPASAHKMGQLTRIRTGKLDANAADEGGTYPFFTCAVEPLRINTPAYDCKAVLVAGNGDLNVKYFEGKFNAYQRTYVIESVDESVLLPGFLYGFLDLYVSELRKQAIGGVIKYIKLPYLTEAKIQLPSLASQQEFRRHVASVEKLRAAHEASLVQLGVLFSTLQHRAFRGEL